MDIRRSFYDSRHDHGFWSPSTSSANFCEEDYVVSHYIAEFVNTLSNFAYLYYALCPPPLRLGDSSDDKHPTFRDRVRSLDVQSFSLILVGVTSGIFHASMHALPQWLDESSMYLLAGSWIYILLTTSYVSEEKAYKARTSPIQNISIRRTNKTFVLGGLMASLALSSLASHLTGSLDIHSVVFALLLTLSGLKLIYFIFAVGSTPNSTSVIQKRRKVLLAKLTRAIILLCLGFSLWLIDCNPAACHYLRGVRHMILSKSSLLHPLTFLLQLHGWWHILTARAAGEYISLVRYLTTEKRDYPAAKKHA